MRALVCFSTSSGPTIPPASWDVRPLRGQSALRSVLGEFDPRDVEDGWVAVRAEDPAGGVWREVARFRVSRARRGGDEIPDLESAGDPELSGLIDARYRYRSRTVMGSDIARYLTRLLNRMGALVRAGVWIVPNHDALPHWPGLHVIRLPEGTEAVRAALAHLAEKGRGVRGVAQARAIQKECDQFRALFGDELERIDSVERDALMLEISTLSKGEAE